MLRLVLGWQAADGVDWSRLFHAYGAATDTPAYLRALIGGDLDGQLAAFDHLDSAVLHQGTVYSVTPVAVRVVAGLLHEPALRRTGHQATSAAGGPGVPRLGGRQRRGRPDRLG